MTAKNGNVLFLPAAGYRNDASLNGEGSFGYYWSSSLGTSNADRACNINFDRSYHDTYYNSRCNGRSVRPVTE